MEKVGDLLADDRRPAEAAIGKTVELVQQAADSPRAQGTVGKQCTSFVLPVEPDVPGNLEYHSGVVTNTIHGVDIIDAVHGFLIMDPADWTEEGTSEAAMAGPKLGRNEPCWCGSGRKYKRCHGR